MRKIIIGVMGPGEQASAIDIASAYQLGELIAKQGWVLLTGGRKAGVMDAACKGAKAVGGLTVGILPTKSEQDMSDSVDIAIFTGMGNARNQINILSSDVAIACGMGMGTASEIALALKSGKKVILLGANPEAKAFFTHLSPQKVLIADNPPSAINLVKQVISQKNDPENTSLR